VIREWKSEKGMDRKRRKEEQNVGEEARVR
jgi:hypothetical protein